MQNKDDKKNYALECGLFKVELFNAAIKYKPNVPSQ